MLQCNSGFRPGRACVLVYPIPTEQIEKNVFDSNVNSDIYLYVGSEADQELVAPNTGINVGNIFK